MNIACPNLRATIGGTISESLRNFRQMSAVWQAGSSKRGKDGWSNGTSYVAQDGKVGDCHGCGLLKRILTLLGEMVKFNIRHQKSFRWMEDQELIVAKGVPGKSGACQELKNWCSASESA